MASAQRLTSAFMIGYFISYLRSELAFGNLTERANNSFLFTTMRPQIFSTLSDLFTEIFGESIIVPRVITNEKDPSAALNQLYELISEKIQRGGESFLEISFLCGGLTSLIEKEEYMFIDNNKYEAILFHFFSSIGLSLCCGDLNKMVEELIKGSLQTKRDSRNQLLSLICNNRKNHKNIYEIQNFFEICSSNEIQAFA